MLTYKLFREKNGKLYPLFVETGREMEIGRWLEAGIGKKADETHVKSRLGSLSLRPGFHSTQVPFTDWIGRKGKDGTLYQRPDTVWCECEVDGKQEETGRNGKRTLPEDWYYFKTKPNQPFPWIISNRIYIRRKLSQGEVENICRSHGVTAQPMFEEE